MEIVKDYLLHFSFILFPIFLYQVFWLSKPDLLVPRANRLLVAVFARHLPYYVRLFPSRSFIPSVTVCADSHYRLPALFRYRRRTCRRGGIRFFQLIWFEPSALFSYP